MAAYKCTLFSTNSYNTLLKTLYNIVVSADKIVIKLDAIGWNHSCAVYQLHPNISMHILHTVLYTFPKVVTRRNCFAIKSSFC